jgi:hypothetical protein
MYDVIYQVLFVEDVLLLKPFLVCGFAGVIRWKSPALEMFFQLAKHAKVRGGHGAIPLMLRSRNGFGSKTFSPTARTWKISSDIMTNA